jgi:Trk K+ transport system NAD-binding subunit
MSPLIELFRSFLRNYPGRQNGLLLLRFLIIFMTCVLAYSLLFQVFMAYEGRSYGWLTGLYWTLTVMSTLGFGDITFTSDLGRVFTMCVLISGVAFFLILLSILFLEGQSAARVPRELPRDTRGHVVLCHYDAVASALIMRLRQYHQPYVLLVPDLLEALRLHDGGLHVMVGEIDHPDTFRRARVDQAALVATTSTDASNVNVTFTVRDIAPAVPMIATANPAVAVNMLKLAGCSHALHLGDMLGRSLARRIHGGDTATHVIGQFDPLLIAEADAGHTPMVGATLRQCRLRERVGLSVVGVWERGHFQMAGPETRIGSHTILVLAGSHEQLRQYDKQFAQSRISDAPVVILGGGRVGRATGETLEERGLDYRIIEKLPEHVGDPMRYIVGNATDIEVLRKAGLMDAPTIVMTTHDDDINIYLTLYCRFLRPDIQIISRATFERNVATLHRAGADFVMSYASMGANAIWNLLQRSDVLMVTEGLNVFKVPLPPVLIGKTIVEAAVRQVTGCHVIAIQTDGVMHINPDPHTPLPEQGEIILIGTAEAERKFLHQYA